MTELDLLLYAAFLALCVIGPGIAVQILAGLAVDACLVLPIGIVVAAALWQLGLVGGHPGLILVVSGAFCLVVLLRRGGAWTPTAFRPVVIPLLVFALAAWCTRGQSNRISIDGTFRFDPLSMHDDAVHVGLTFDLLHRFPPRVPGLANMVMPAYHLAPDLLRAAAAWITGLTPYDLISRYEPLLGAAALLLAVAGWAQAAGFTARAAALAPWMVLAGDLTFLLPGSGYDASLDGSMMISVLLGNNGLALAMALAFGAFLALRRFERGEGPGYGLCASLLLLGLPTFKVFVALGVLGGAAVTLARRPQWNWSWALVFVPGAALTGLLALGSTNRVDMAFAPLAGVVQRMHQLGLPSSEPSFETALALLAFLGGLSFRGLALVDLWKARHGNTTAFPEGATAVSCLAAGLLLSIRLPDAYPGTRLHDESSYFREAGFAFLAILSAEPISRMCGRLARVFLFLVAFGGSLGLVAGWAEAKPFRIPGEIVEAMSALQRASDPDDVVLHRARGGFPPPPLVLAGRAVAFSAYFQFLTRFDSVPALRTQQMPTSGFFSASDPETALSHARHINARFACYYASSPSAFDPGRYFEPVFEGREIRVYRLVLRAGHERADHPSDGS